MCEAILGHATYTGVPRTTRMAKALFASDELTGLITASALVKPSRAIADVDVAGLRKKMKDKAFARGVNRDTQQVISAGIRVGPQHCHTRFLRGLAIPSTVDSW